MTDAASKQTWMLYVFRCTRHRLHCLSRALRLSSACYTTSYWCRKRELWQNMSVMSAPASAAHSHYSLYDGMGALWELCCSEPSGCLLTCLTFHQCACDDVWSRACRFWLHMRAGVVQKYTWLRLELKTTRSAEAGVMTPLPSVHQGS